AILPKRSRRWRRIKLITPGLCHSLYVSALAPCPPLRLPPRLKPNVTSLSRRPHRRAAERHSNTFWAVLMKIGNAGVALDEAGCADREMNTGPMASKYAERAEQK